MSMILYGEQKPAKADNGVSKNNLVILEGHSRVMLSRSEASQIQRDRPFAAAQSDS
jgi:hypothetical protein